MFFCVARSLLGPDLVFVVLDMEVKAVEARVLARHGGHEGMKDMLLVNMYYIQNL